MRYVKQTVSALSMALISIASAYVMDVDEVMCEDVYNVQLKVETVEVDINEIPENREVRVGVSIENNPGFLGLRFPIEWDSRLGSFGLSLYDYSNDNLGVGHIIIDTNDNIIISEIHNKDLNSLFFGNGNLYYFNFVLPENVVAGDFFPVNIYDRYYYMEIDFYTMFTQENSFDNDHGPESFAPFINGGIRIVGQEPEPVQEPPQESEPPIQPSEPDIAPPQPAGDNQQNNNVQQQVIAETAAPVTEATTTETTTATTSTTTVTTVPETTVSATVSTTETEKTTTEETTVLETTVTEVSENSIDDEEGKRNIIPIMVAGITVIAAVITGLIFRRKKGEQR
ncbi:MAG: hypothetical protein PUE12_11790 [Oscillospiraceae bacterium]|nr:hypothetical protein [Oscillospiraceae bacterium]